MTLSMTQATGSCRNGSFSMESSQYFSRLPEPQVASVAAATRPAARIPNDPRSMVSRGGCTPTFSMHARGPTPPTGRFTLYSNIAMQPQDASSENASGFAFVNAETFVRLRRRPWPRCSKFRPISAPRSSARAHSYSSSIVRKRGLSTFPIALRGSAAVRYSVFGTLKLASRFRKLAPSSSKSTVSSASRKATGSSPRAASLRPMTAAARMPG